MTPPLPPPAAPSALGPRAAAPLVAAWCWLHAPVLRWLGRVALAHPSYAVNLLLLLVALGVLALRLRRRGAPLLVAPTCAPLPLGVLLGAACAYAAAERFVQIHILEALLMGLGAYGLVGLVLPPALFRRGLPAALLLCALLPFGAHGSTLIGMGARVLCARAVQAFLHGLGVVSTSAETVLVLESGVAHVDVPCSGLRSLWAGLVFFFAASWLGRHRPGGRWLLCGALCAALLLSANTLRVLALVLCALVAKRPDLAEVIHVPLGALGFLASCALTLLVLRAVVPRAAPDGPAASASPLSPAALLLLAALLAAPALLRAALPPPAVDPAPAPIHLPGIEARAEPLSGGERALFSRFGARADKWRFATGGLRGSILTVSATALRAQHPPELCLAAAGLRIERMETDGGAGFPVRRLLLRGGELSAVYWFQSRARTTPDFWTRLGRAFLGERRWVMVSILLDDARPPADPELGALLRLVRDAVQRSVEGDPR